jgi:hypothetical protein
MGMVFLQRCGTTTTKKKLKKKRRVNGVAVYLRMVKYSMEERVSFTLYFVKNNNGKLEKISDYKKGGRGEIKIAWGQQN